VSTLFRFLLLLALGTPAAAQAPEPVMRALSRDEILAAMQQSQGYEPTATTNGARFQAEVLLRLARDSEARDSARPPLFVGHDEWFSAYLARTGLTAEGAPLFMRLGHDNGQDMIVDYGRDRVIRSVAEGPTPSFAMSVSIGWPETPGAPKSYSYEDALSSPRLKATNKSLITYRLLDYGGMIVFDDIEGLYGRPTSGLLGFLFSVIGEGHVEQNRMTISQDGLQISRARAARAFFHVETTVTVYADGRTEKDLPANRPDLVALETRLKQPLEVEYLPIRLVVHR
jgi:hypothetical protein